MARIMLQSLLLATALLLPDAAARGDGLEGAVVASQGDIPAIGLGTWLSGKKEVKHAAQYALDHGYTHIDAAHAYGNERQVGKGIKKSALKRQDLWVTSKLWNTDHRDPERAIERTLHDLKLDYLDLYLMHWPVAFRKDGRLDLERPITATWRDMEALVRANKTRYIGVSNFAPADVDAILSVCEVCPYAHELEAHPYLQQQEYVDWHRARGMQVIAYSPLANVNPHYRSGLPSLLDDPFWVRMARTKNVTVPQAVLAWGLQRGTAVIPKSVRDPHVRENLGALGVVYAPEEMMQIAAQDRKVRMNNPGREWGVNLFDGLDDPTALDTENEL
jgi:alcohol dehydrogenase (NADP+)